MSSPPTSFGKDVFVAWYPTGPTVAIPDLKNQWNFFTIRWAVVPPRVSSDLPTAANPRPNFANGVWASGIIQIRVEPSGIFLRSWSEPRVGDEVKFLTDAKSTAVPIRVSITNMLTDWQNVTALPQFNKSLTNVNNLIENALPIYFHVAAQGSQFVIKRLNAQNQWVTFFDKLSLSDDLKAAIRAGGELCIVNAEWQSSIAPNQWVVNSCLVSPICPSCPSCPSGTGCGADSECVLKSDKANWIAAAKAGGCGADSECVLKSTKAEWMAKSCTAPGSKCFTQAEQAAMKAACPTGKNCLGGADIVTTKECKDAVAKASTTAAPNNVPLATWVIYTIFGVLGLFLVIFLISSAACGSKKKKLERQLKDINMSSAVLLNK